MTSFIRQWELMPITILLVILGICCCGQVVSNNVGSWEGPVFELCPSHLFVYLLPRSSLIQKTTLDGSADYFKILTFD